MYENFKEGSEGERNIKRIEQTEKQYNDLIFHRKLQINHIFIMDYN